MKLLNLRQLSEKVDMCEKFGGIVGYQRQEPRSEDCFICGQPNDLILTVDNERVHRDCYIDEYGIEPVERKNPWLIMEDADDD